MKIPKWLSRTAGGESSGDLPLIDAVSSHVKDWISEDFTVLHEKKSEIVHVDVYCVPPSKDSPCEDRPFYTLVTSGMAELPMKPPPTSAGYTHGELIMFLPPDWPMDRLTTDKAAQWPVQVMQRLARYPHQNDTWLWLGHSLSLGDLGVPGVRFDSALLYFPYFLDAKKGNLAMEDGRNILFMGITLLYPEELELLRKENSTKLFDIADEMDVELLLVDPDRPSLVTL